VHILSYFSAGLLLSLTALTLSAQTAAPGGGTPAAESAAKTGSLAGSVVNAQSGEPLKRAEVVASDDLPGGPPLRAITDSSGKFKLPGVSAGTYRISIARPGFVPARGKDSDSAPEVITLTPGQEITGLVYRLSPGAVLAGRVVDEDGAPFAGIRLQCLKYSFTPRMRRLVTAGSTTSDDRGQYRFAGLNPGGYYVYASYSDAGALLGGAPSGAVEGYPSVYYPGVPSAVQAAEIPLRAGEERNGVDFKFAPARLRSVHGTVRNPDGRPAARDTLVSLAPRASAGLGGRTPTRVSDDGDFRVDGVAPGSYLLTVMAGGGLGNTVRVPLEVGETNLENINVILKPRIDLKGRIRVEGDRPQRLDGVQLFLSPADGAVLMEGGSGIAAPRPDGTFLFHAVAEGDYGVQADNLPEDSFLKEVLVSGRAAPDRIVHLSEATANALELVLSDKGGRIEGIVKDDKQRAVSSTTVVLVPDASRRGQAELFRTATSDQYGHFTIRGIPHGDYKLFAWSENLEPWSWREPGVLAPYESQGKSVSIDESGRVTLELVTLAVQ
jgi:hypothetical protein